MIENETVRPKGSGKPYHTDCFCCVKCEQPLQGKYFTNETGMICENCFAVSINKNSDFKSGPVGIQKIRGQLSPVRASGRPLDAP